MVKKIASTKRWEVINDVLFRQMPSQLPFVQYYNEALFFLAMYRFPPRLLDRLRRASKKLESYTPKMKSADHRFHHSPAGASVHEINLSRQTRQKFVIKKVHNTASRNWSAQETLHDVRLRLEIYRSTNGAVMRRHHFTVSVVPAEVISEKLLLMPRVSAPTVMELVLRKHALKSGEPSRTTSRYDKQLFDIEWIGNHLMNELHVDNLGDIFYLGRDKNKQHRFMLAADIFIFG